MEIGCNWMFFNILLRFHILIIIRTCKPVKENCGPSRLYVQEVYRNRSCPSETVRVKKRFLQRIYGKMGLKSGQDMGCPRGGFAKGEGFMERKKHSILSNLRYWAKYYLKNAPSVFWISLADILLYPCFQMLALYFPKVTLGLIEGGAPPERLALVLAGYTLLFLAAKGISRAIGTFNNMTLNKERQRVVFQLFLKSLHVSYAYTESEEGRNDYRKAVEVQNRGDFSASSQFIVILRELAGTVLTFVLYSTVLSTLNLWMVFILLALAGLGYLLNLRENRFQNSLRPEEAVTQKHFFYMKGAMGNVSAAKDIRIFGMRKWLQERMDGVSKAREKLEWRRAVWVWKNGFLGRILNLIRDLGAYAYLIYMACAGDMTVSDFVLYFGAITGFSGFVRDVASALAGLQQASEDTEWARGYLEMPEEDISGGSRHINELAQPIAIEFRDVSFSYVSGDNRTKVFSHLNLQIKAGEKMALVGANGAGKTTLVKLLCGFYEPEEGSILFNGIDAREFPRAERYSLFSVVFQEMFFPPMRVDESITLQEAENVDQDRLREALEKAKMWDVLQEKGIAMNQYMGNLKKKGVELSGGQYQKLLLARALYQGGAVLVLDEPTAALDPIAESQVYDAYQEYSSGRTSVFISHRLASTGFSDRIVLLDAGKIAEMGSHQELMEKNGLYAEMFRIQSSYYQAAGQQGGTCAEATYTA